jgi:branched-chain amino acid transport system permease protein
VTASPIVPPNTATSLPVKKLAMTVAIAAAGTIPFALSPFATFQLTQAMIYLIALFGLNLLTGFNGQISLGHGAFYAIGAYVAALLIAHGGWPYWATLPASGAICFAAGFLFGFPALRLSGHYLALATLALGVTMPQILKYKGFEHWTGGFSGLILEKPEAPGFLPLNPDQWLFEFTLAVMLVMLLLASNIVSGRTGRAIVAVRDQPLAAEAMGIDLAMIKTSVFGISALYAGVAGALHAAVVAFVSPESFGLGFSIALVVGVAVGGLTSLWGAFFGALFIMYVPDFAETISKGAPWAIYGVCLILVMYLMPNGIAGAAQALWLRIASCAAGWSVDSKRE